jgi:hypothetical protein
MVDHDRAQDIWTTQSQETFTMSVEDIRTHAASFQGKISARNWREQAVGALLALVFLGVALIAEQAFARFAMLAAAAGNIYVMWQLHRQARAAHIDEVCLVTDWRHFHRAELVRQRDALRTVWRWYLGPLVPGVVLGVLAVAYGAWSKGNVAEAVVMAVLGPLVMAAVFQLIAWINMKAAGNIQTEIDKIDRMNLDNGSSQP